jgi:hypothetical protein
MKNIAMPIASLLLLIAVPAGAAVNPALDYSNRLMKLSDIQQRAVMRRAILDGVQYCKQVLATAYQGSYKNLVMWTAHCAKGGDYAVYIGPDGSAQVRPCTDLAKLNLPLCRLPVAPSVIKPHR